MDKKLSKQNPTLFVVGPTVLGKTWAHDNTREVFGTDPSQSGIIRVKPLIDAYKKDGGKKIGEFKNRDNGAEYLVERYQGAPNPKSVQGFYDQRIKPGNKTELMLQFLSEEMHKAPGGIYPAALEPMILEMLPIMQNDPRFTDLNLKIGIMYDNGSDRELKENIEFQSKRAESMKKGPDVIKKNAGNYIDYNNLAKETLVKNPEYRPLPYGQAIHNGARDLQFFDEALRANKIPLTSMKAAEKEAKGTEKHEILVASSKDLMKHYSKPEKGEWPEHLKD